MKMKKFFSKLWNGGMDPSCSDPKLLGERRTIAAVSFIIVPCSLLLIVSHLSIFDTDYHRVVVIGGVLVAGLFSLYAQAYRDAKRASAITLVAALWLAPVSLMIEEGFSSTNWAWLFVLILLANYVMSRRVAIVFAVLSVLVMVAVAYFTVNGELGYPVEANAHAITVAISGSLIFILASALGYSYRTNQLRSEEKLHKNMAVLAEEVEVRRTAELKALAGERAKATFLTTVSHELRTPLNGVIGASALLSDKELDSDIKDLVKIVNDSGEILLEVINNVLDYSRLDEGELELRFSPMDIRETVQSSLAPLIVMCTEKGLKLNVEIDDGVPGLVNGDSARIRQILLNLCGNAIKFTAFGSIDVFVRYSEEHAYFTITDTGIGIAENKLSEIFSPFSQVESSVDRRFGGSGLGLSIVNRLVDLFEGEIKVESQLGVGTSFIVKLPLQEMQESLVERTQDESKVDNSKPSLTNSATVLVTDDNDINRKVASQLLLKLGHKVIEAKDGEEAVISIQERDVDLVLMDIQMPKMDGLTATSRIRRLKGARGNTPIIGLTANAMPDDQAEMLAVGMNACLAKPVRLEQLKKMLDDTYINSQTPK